MAAGEQTLAEIRPTRLVALRYYIGTGFFLILAGVFYFQILRWFYPAFPSGTFADWTTDRLAGVAFLVLAVLLLLAAELIRKATKYTITDHRIIREDGILSKHKYMAPYTQLERVDLHQTILQRILRIGSVKVDTGDDKIDIEMIPKPREIQELLSKRMGRRAYGGDTQPPNP
jgi:uncharacterized membrane protein YdbT with pleckstrin-like domain